MDVLIQIIIGILGLALSIAVVVGSLKTVGMNFGGMLASFGMHKRALAYLDKRISKKPNDALAYAQRAEVRFTLNDAEGAIADYTNALESDIAKLDKYVVNKGAEALVLTERAQVYFDQSDYQNALNDLKLAHKQKPDFHTTVAWLAITNFAVGNVDKATDLWKTAKSKHKPYAKLNKDKWIAPTLSWQSRPILDAQEIIDKLNQLTNTTL